MSAIEQSVEAGELGKENLGILADPPEIWVGEEGDAACGLLHLIDLVDYYLVSGLRQRDWF